MDNKHIMVLANDTTYTFNLRKELLAALIEKGYRVTIVGEILKRKEELEALGCRLISVKVGRQGTDPAKDLALLHRYKTILRQEKPDVVLTYNIKPNIYGAMACRSRKIPYIMNITGLGTALENPGLLKSVLITMYKYALAKAACVFFQNEANRQFFETRGLLKTKNRCIPGSGVNVKKFSMEPYPQEECRLVFVGRVMRDKGVGELFAAAEIIKEKHPDVIFDIVGGYDDEHYASQIQRLEAAGVLKYWGAQSDVRPFLKKAGAIVLPSYHEGMANVLLEASAMGRPVLASRVPGCAETFDEGVTGFGFEAKDHQDLVRAIEAFLRVSPEQRAQMGRSAREKVQREFDRQLVVNAYMEEIELLF